MNLWHIWYAKFLLPVSLCNLRGKNGSVYENSKIGEQRGKLYSLVHWCIFLFFSWYIFNIRKNHTRFVCWRIGFENMQRHFFHYILEMNQKLWFESQQTYLCFFGRLPRNDFFVLDWEYVFLSNETHELNKISGAEEQGN